MVLPEILSVSIQTLRAHSVTISWGRKTNIGKGLCSLHVHILDIQTCISDVRCVSRILVTTTTAEWMYPYPISLYTYKKAR